MFFFLVCLQLLQAVFFTVCLVDDLIGTSEAVPTTRPFTRRLRDTVSVKTKQNINTNVQLFCVTNKLLFLVF